MKFKDREVAGQVLSLQLRNYKKHNTIILAIPRGGVPVGYAIASALEVPLELILSKKIGHPGHKEFAIGAVTLENRVLGDAAAHVSSEYIEMETSRIREKLKNKYYQLYGHINPRPLNGKVVILVDDGIATGNTMLSTIKMIYDKQPEKIVVAIPVSSTSALKKLRDSPMIDEVVCLLEPDEFRAVGQFYEDFDQVDDLTVKELLDKANYKFSHE